MRDRSFEEWVSGHVYAEQIGSFLEWIEETEEMDTGKIMNRRRRAEIEESIMYLDDLSVRMQTAGILVSSIFKSNQFLNADKLMRTAKKNSLINQVLVEVPMDERPDVEENMWYVMRLYSIFLDFYKLSPKEVQSFAPTLEKLALPKKVVQKQYIFWGILGGLLILLTVVSVILLGMLHQVVFAALLGIIMAGSIAAFWFFGVKKSLPFQFKDAIKNADLYCVRGQICDVGIGQPFASVKYETQTLNISTLHDSLGKLFTFYAVDPVAVKTDGSTYQLIYVKDINLAIEALPVRGTSSSPLDKEKKAVEPSGPAEN